MSERIAGLALVLMLCSGAAVADRDPTRPAAGWVGQTPAPVSRAHTTELRLNAILYGEQRRRARIGERWLGVGDEIDGARVVDIRPDRVRLQRADGPLVLMLGGGEAPALGKVFRERKQ
ncbi:hypothetical protein [Alkalilimnicola sp. S0819]|uniref:hypothetical protein n=1 Tax=Alkalilimnicola sp. S0819 TaxID=2613922 RepID=UPI001261E136|nr:hypothetical protein [Alkalilimnicola sp. S0819]KAB7622642.1 hypothetical protein F3N43_12290 [Alkalilimnicola sp. S0819]MPQ17413.1 hypothetical protein [Alkalilimnicola sp. S0819]